MTAFDHRRLLEGLLPALCEAGRIELRYFRSGVAVEHKDDRSPVTAADREAETCLLASLHGLCPDVPVIAEEEVAAGRVPAIEAAFFLVDPLDGTREFIKGVAEFTINVALIVDTRPVVGVVYAPAQGELFATIGPGQAAWTKLDAAETSPTITSCSWQALRGRMPHKGALVAAESRSHRVEGIEKELQRLGVTSSVRVGSALKFGLLARGDADVYLRLGETGEWDTAAGHAVLEAAGGLITQIDGTPLTYGKAHRNYVNPPFIAWSRRPDAN